MHLAAHSYSDDALRKCKMLPVADLGKPRDDGSTPLHDVAWTLHWLRDMRVSGRVERLQGVLQWMLDQPECPIDAPDDRRVTAAGLLTASAHDDLRLIAMLPAARAAWTGAVAGACKK
jgi:hypothetical protein